MRTIEKQLDIVEFKALTNDRPGTFEAVVARFDSPDRQDEQIVKGAFGASLAKNEGRFPIIWAHQWLEPPIGISLKGEEIDQGLKFKGRLFVDKNQRASEVFHAMQEGALREWSFGATVDDEDTVQIDGRQVTLLKSLNLVEFGPCLRGVHPDTFTVGLKAAAQAALEELARSDEQDKPDSEVTVEADVTKEEDAQQETVADPDDNSQTMTVEQKRVLLDMGIGFDF